MSANDGDETHDLRSSAFAEDSEDESRMMFEASSDAHSTKSRRTGPWGGPGERRWKRLLAAWVEAGGIRVGRFPK